MATVSRLGNFPFCIPSAQQWDGSTYIPAGGGSGNYVASGSSETYVPVFGQGTPFPVGYTLDEVMQLYWRIAVWQVKMEVFDFNFAGDKATINASFATEANSHSYYYEGVTFDEHGIPPDYWTIIDSPEIVYSGPTYPETNEKYMVCHKARRIDIYLDFRDAQTLPSFPPYEPPATTFFQPTGTQIIAEDIPDLILLNNLLIERNSTPPQPTFFFGPELSMEMFKEYSVGFPFTIPAMVRDDDSGLYYPQISLWLYPTGSVDDYALYSSKAEAAYEFTGSEVAVYVGSTINILGKSIDLYRRQSGTAAESVTMTPKYWWPYDPNDGGGPIYDVNTGDQLRSFP